MCSGLETPGCSWCPTEEQDGLLQGLQDVHTSGVCQSLNGLHVWGEEEEGRWGGGPKPLPPGSAGSWPAHPSSTVRTTQVLQQAPGPAGQDILRPSLPGFPQPPCLSRPGTRLVFHRPENLPPCFLRGGNTKGRASPGWGWLEGGGSSFLRKHHLFHLAEPPVHLGHGGPCRCPSPTHFLGAPLLLCSGCPRAAVSGNWMATVLTGPKHLRAGQRPTALSQVTAARGLARLFL